MFKRFLTNETGTISVEYSAIACFASITIYAGAHAIGETLVTKYYGALVAAWPRTPG